MISVLPSNEYEPLPKNVCVELRCLTPAASAYLPSGENSYRKPTVPVAAIQTPANFCRIAA